MKKLLFICLVFSLSVSAQEPRNFLEKAISEKQLESIIVKDNKWIPFPSYWDRARWNNIDVALKKSIIAQANKCLDYQYQFVPASSYLAFAITGDRNIMQKPYDQNCNTLQNLVLGELLEGKGRFLPQIIKGLHNLFEMQTWALSAHLSLQGKDSKPGVIDSTQNIIDLVVGRTGAIVAWTYYFLGDVLDKLEPGIKQKSASELNRRIVEPYADRTDFWWMALEGQRLVNNWDVWCNYNSLICILLTEQNPKRKAELIHKTMISVDKFLNYYKDDGACDEGPSYWSEAGGNLFLYLDLLKRVSAGKIDIFDKALVGNIAAYIYKVYIGDGYYVNFADAHTKASPNAGLVYGFGKAVRDDSMQSFGKYLSDGQKLAASDIFETLSSLFDHNTIKQTPSRVPLLLDVDYPQTQIVAARDQKDSEKGFYFAAKGGNNDESHNHNDVGSFILYYDAHPFLIDMGSGTYTAQTFSSRRYELLNTRSLNHNIPLINGVEQQAGAKFKATDFNYSSSPLKVGLTIGIENAYPKNAFVDKWNRTYTLERGNGFIVEDAYTLKKYNGKTSINFLTPIQPKQGANGRLVFDIAGKSVFLDYDKNIVDCQIVPIVLDDPSFIHQWGRTLYRIELVLKSHSLTGKNKVDIHL